MGITEQIIAYIVEKLSGKVTKTQLLKLIYLADFESVKYSGNQLSEIKWFYHHYGPYDKSLDKRLQLLEKEKFIKVEQKNKKSHPDEIYFVYQATDKRINNDFSPVQKDILETIINQFGSFTLSSLLDYVYHTSPMQGAVKGRIIDLNNEVAKNVQPAR